MFEGTMEGSEDADRRAAEASDAVITSSIGEEREREEGRRLGGGSDGNRG